MYRNLDIAFKLALDNLRIKDPNIVSQNAYVFFDITNRWFRVPFLGSTYIVELISGKIYMENSSDEVSPADQLLILHYLGTANGSPLKNSFISFRELPDGMIYNEPFKRRSINPFAKAFGNNSKLFLSLAQKIGGEEIKIGDAGFSIYAFPRIPITYVLYFSDDEFPASANILFDASAPNYLPTEDYAVLCSLIVYKLCEMAKLPDNKHD